MWSTWQKVVNLTNSGQLDGCIKAIFEPWLASIILPLIISIRRYKCKLFILYNNTYILYKLFLNPWTLAFIKIWRERWGRWVRVWVGDIAIIIAGTNFFLLRWRGHPRRGTLRKKKDRIEKIWEYDIDERISEEIYLIRLFIHKLVPVINFWSNLAHKTFIVNKFYEFVSHIFKRLQ